MITEEIQKRPLVRPLFIWITGIIMQTFFRISFLPVILLVIAAVIILFSYISRQKVKVCKYQMRWVWGFVFLSLLLSMSMIVTGYHEIKPYSSPSTPLQQTAGNIQLSLLSKLDKLSLTNTEKSVLSTLALGYRKTMPRDVRNQFSVTGVAHLLAVSGFHVGIVCGFISFVLSILSLIKTGRWIRYLITIFLLWIFVAVTGLAASSVRAATMISLYLTGKQLHRMTDGYNTLAASAFCMLVYNPFYLFDIGFQLSYTAVFFILFLNPMFSGQIEIRNPLFATPWSWITVTLSAQAGVTFLSLYYFGYFSSVFLMTNLPLTLISTLLIPMVFLFLLLPAWIPGTGFLEYGIEVLTHSMVRIVEMFSRVPGSTFTFRFGFLTMILSYGSFLLLLVYIRYKRPRFLIASLVVVAIILFIVLIEKYLHKEI